MQYAKTLSREEMKEITAGVSCRLFFRDDDGSAVGYGPRAFDPDTAQGIYDGSIESIGQQGQYVSGYCCTSCGSDGFSNANPC